MNRMKDMSRYSNHMKRQHSLLSTLRKKLQRNNRISLTKNLEKNTNRIERLKKLNYDFQRV